MVIYYVHHHAETIVVQRLDHLFHLGDPYLPVEGVCGVAAFGYIVVHGIIAPVIPADIGPALVHRAKVKDRKQLHMGDPQSFDVIQTRGGAVGECGPGFRQAQEFALMADVGAVVEGQVPQMQLVDDRVRNGLAPVGIGVGVPAVRVGGGKVQDHGPAAVDAGGSGVGIAGLPAVHQVGIIHPVPVPGKDYTPGALNIPLHGQLLQQVIPQRITAAIQANTNPGGGGSPEPQAGFLPGPGGPQVAA